MEIVVYLALFHIITVISHLKKKQTIYCTADMFNLNAAYPSLYLLLWSRQFRWIFMVISRGIGILYETLLFISLFFIFGKSGINHITLKAAQVSLLVWPIMDIQGNALKGKNIVSSALPQSFPISINLALRLSEVLKVMFSDRSQLVFILWISQFLLNIHTLLVIGK